MSALNAPGEEKEEVRVYKGNQSFVLLTSVSNVDVWVLKFQTRRNRRSLLMQQPTQPNRCIIINIVVAARLLMHAAIVYEQSARWLHYALASVCSQRAPLYLCYSLCSFVILLHFQADCERPRWLQKLCA